MGVILQNDNFFNSYFQSGCFTSELSQIRLGRASMIAEHNQSIVDLPPSYSTCQLDPPSYNDTVKEQKKLLRAETI